MRNSRYCCPGCHTPTDRPCRCATHQMVTTDPFEATIDLLKRDFNDVMLLLGDEEQADA